MRQNVYTVAQINSYIKNMFTQDYMLRYVLVKGEISNCKYHSSGHIYFTLKDAKGVIACVMFAGNRTGLSFRLEEGQMVVVGGTMTCMSGTESISCTRNRSRSMVQACCMKSLTA